MVSGVVNKHFKMWLWILIGLNIITKVHGYGDGLFDDTSCQSMLVKHLRDDKELRPQDTELPFEIDYKLGNEGDPITVILRSKQSTEFRGFILQARKNGSDVPVGRFIALESHSTRLLQCNGSPDSAVSQPNNRGKTLFRVNWTSPEIDDGIFFRVTFVQYYDTFWRPVDENIPLRTTTSLPTTTPSTTTSTVPSITTNPEPSITTSTVPSTEPSITTNPEPSITTNPEPSITTSTVPSTEPSITTNPEPSITTNPEPSITTSTVPSTEPSITTNPEPSIITSTVPSTEPSITTTLEPSIPVDPPAPNTFGRAVIGPIAVSVIVVIGKALHTIFDTLPNNPFSHRRLNRVSKITCSLLCAAVEFSTLVLFCVAEPINITLIALVCMAIVINFVELVILCLPIGPSHELKEICDITVKVCSVIHQIFTIAVIFVGVMETENCRNGTGISYRKHSWLLKVMVAYTVWILLFVIWDFIICTQRTAILGRSKIGSPKWRKQQRKEKLRAAEWIVIAVSVILLVGNLCFGVAVAVGVFECQKK